MRGVQAAPNAPDIGRDVGAPAGPQGRRRRSGIRDLVVLGVAVAAFFAVGAVLGLFEDLGRRLAATPPLADLFALAVLVLAGGTVLGLRRWGQVEGERALRVDAEARFRALVEESPAVSYTWDPVRRTHRYVSPQIEHILGYTPHEWAGDEDLWHRVVDEAQRDALLAASLEADRTGTPFLQEYRMRAKDGRAVWIRDESNYVKFAPDGTPLLAHGVMYDITRQKEAEERASVAEQRYRTLIEQLPAVTYIEDADTGRNLYISPQIETLFGYTPEEWLADPDLWRERLHPDDRDWVIAANDADTGDTWSVDYRTITRDGRVVWLHNEAVLIRDDDGRPAFWQGVCFDVTERRVAEERVRAAEERHRRLIEHLPVAVYTDAVDDLSTALYISPQYEDLTGYSPEQRLLDPGLWTRMLHPDDRDRVLAESIRTNESGDPFDIEYRIVRADGRVAWLHDHAMLVGGPTGTRIWQGVLQDVTERRVAQDALARRDAILQATGFAAERFLRSPSWQTEIVEVLGRLGVASGAGRTTLWANDRGEDGELLVSQLESWSAPGVPSRRDETIISRFPWVEGGFRRWMDLLGSGQIVHGHIGDFPETEHELLARDPFGIHALLAIPVFVDDEWWGYLGFDQGDGGRSWHDAEIEALMVTANTLGAAIARTRAAGELAETQRRYQTLIEQIPAMTYIERAFEGGAIYTSPQTHQVLGYAEDEWNSYEHWLGALHPDDRERVVQEDARTNETGEPFRAEYRLIAKDGHVVWVRDEAVLVRADEGTPLYWQGVRFDITAEKESEEQLRAAEERYRGIVEHVPAAIYLDRADASMQSIYVSPQIEAITGVSADRWLEEPELWLELTHPDDRQRIRTSYLVAAQERTPWSAEYRMRTPDGRTIWVHDETTILHDEQGKPIYMQGVIFDTTEQKLAEQALRESEQREREAAERLRSLDEMKNTFLAAVSHELRSPLTSILGLSLTLERGPEIDSDDRADLLRRLAGNAKKLDRLLRDLLDIDRLNRGIVEPQYRVTDIGALARRTVESLDVLAGRDVIAQTDAVVLAVDPPKVERIVENLLANAVRHTEADRRIWVRVHPHDAGALIVVEDDGPGVAEDLRGAIFEPFRQGPTASPHAPGTGIGLSLVARFAELHGGRAWVEERAGGGASFRVFLPGRQTTLGLGPSVARGDTSNVPRADAAG
jgi:PAS domain S-box-containing protein